MRSRFCHRSLPSPPFVDSQAYARALSEVVRADRYEAIHVCHEEVLARMLPALDGPEWMGLLLPPRDKLALALSKNAMVSVAAHAGVATPRTIVPQDEADVEAAARELGVPLVVKGDTGESGETVRLLHDARAASEVYREVLALESRAQARPALQEFVVGPAYSVGGLFLRGRPLRVVAHRKLIRYPYPWGGRTVKGVTEYDPELLREAFKVFAALEYTGLGHVEFIRDQRDGRFKFLEINPRIWGTIAVASYAGVDLFAPYRRIVKGLAVEADLHFRAGVKFHRILREVRLIRQRPQRLPGALIDALDPRVRSDFTWTDLGPYLPSREQTRKFLLRLKHSLKTHLAPEPSDTGA